MTPRDSSNGLRVAVVGASSLLGKELIAVLKERQFPAARLVELDSGTDSELEPPILDLDGGDLQAEFNPEIQPGEIDLAFLAERPNPLPAFLGAGAVGATQRPIIVDLGGSWSELGAPPPRIASLEQEAASGARLDATIAAAAHPVSIVLCQVLLRLASRIEISTAAASVFSPVSQLGPRAIEELQRQTVNLLSFQKPPHAIFGEQLAFNLLPRITGSGSAGIEALQARLTAEIGPYLAGRAPAPAVRILQAPVFYSLAISLYVETKVAINPARAAELLAGNGVRVRRASEAEPSQVEVTGMDDILISPIVADEARSQGLWIWAVADNLRLAAQNAAEIAEDMLGDRKKPASGNGKAVVH